MDLTFQYDSLTSLPDRISFLKYIQREQGKQVWWNDHMYALLLINLDDFRLINQKLGHSIGDQILKQTVERLTDIKLGHHLLARLNGDEFGLFIKDIHDISEVELLAIRIINMAKKTYHVDENEYTLHCSIGISTFFYDGTPTDDILNNTVTALQRAKEDGKCTYRLYQAGMNMPVQRRVIINDALHNSIKQNYHGFSLAYQPRLDLSTNKVIAVEALMRWSHGELGNIPPMEFIPIAEQNNAIIDLGIWGLHEACMQAKQWMDIHQANVKVAVNLSARQFRDVSLVTKIMDVLIKTRLPPSFLEFELTESMLMHDIAEAQKTMKLLKEIGVKLAIDDFGTGYSSLSHLKNFPLDYLKIDKSFISNMKNDKEKAIIQTVITLAHMLDLRVVAEGVETEEQLDFLLEQDCDEVQGYFISRPVSGKQISDMLNPLYTVFASA